MLANSIFDFYTVYYISCMWHSSTAVCVTPDSVIPFFHNHIYLTCTNTCLVNVRLVICLPDKED